MALNEQKRNAIIEYNNNVTKNREIMKRYIDVVCFLATQELAFRGHDESVSSINRGNYIESLKLLSLYDGALNTFQENATVFTGVSSHIQNDLIESVANVVLQSIKLEISECLFIAILLDETSDVSNKSQLSSVVRLVTKSGQIVERFLGYTDVSSDRTANRISKHVLNIMETYGCGSKLIAQTYDGAAVMSGELNGTQAKVREVYPKVFFIHCFAHVLNLVLSQSVSYIKECKIFFAAISGISKFFSHSTKRLDALQNIIKLKLPNAAPTRWNYNSRIVNAVFQHREDLITFFEEIVEHPENWDKDAILSAGGFLNFLTDFSTIFLLNTFNVIFAHTDILYNILQNKYFEINYCVDKINEIKQIISNFREEFTTVFEKTIINTGLPKIKRNLKTQEDINQYFKALFYEIIDTISIQMSARYENLKCLHFVEVLNNKKYIEYKKIFPQKAFDALKLTYGDIFDTVRLTNELIVLYTSTQLHDKPIFELFNYLKDGDLIEVFPEIFKLCALIITIPYTTASVERTFSTLKRVKTYPRNTISEDRLSALSMLSIEQQQLKILKSNSDFYNNVIDIFAKKNRRINLIYK